MEEYMYDLNMFDEGTSAPKPVPQRKEKQKKKLYVVEETVEVKRERINIRQRQNGQSTFFIITVALVLATIASTFVFFGAYINSYDHKIAALQEELDIAKSQNVILNIKKDSMVSFDSVRETAEEAGMIQRDRYEVTYFELTQDNYGVTNNQKS